MTLSTFSQPAPVLAAPHSTPSEAHALKSYPLFDWLRIVLASLVALGHQGMPVIGPIDANLAVIVFLSLSGWLIGGILIESSISQLPRFFFNRATRIWIPYVFAIVLLYGLAAWREGIDANWLKYLFYDATFTHTIFVEFPRALTELPMGGTGNHFWSISIEEIFYLVAPLLILLLPFGKKLWAWVIISAFLLVAHANFGAIALGVLAALAARDYPGWHLRRAIKPLLWLACAGVFALCWPYNTEQMRAIFAVLFVLCLAVPGRRGRLGVFWGSVSYPFYLNHWMGAFLINGLLKKLPAIPPALGILASYIVAVAAGVVTWALVDRWVMRDRGSWYQPHRGVMLGATAYILLLIGIIGGLIIRANGG